MATNTIRIDDSVKEETTRIAAQLGLSFSGVVNILLRKFNADQGFAYPLQVQPEKKKTVIEMSSEEFEQTSRKAVSERKEVPTTESITFIDESGRIANKYADGRVEYVIE